MKNKKMFFVVVLLMICYSCDSKPQTYSEARSNLIGGWVDKNTDDQYLFSAEGVYLYDAKNTPGFDGAFWVLENIYENNHLLFLQKSPDSYESDKYYIYKIGKRKVRLYLDSDNLEDFIELKRYKK